EAACLIEMLNRSLGSGQIKFYPGVSYRNIMVIDEEVLGGWSRLSCTPPHDIAGKHITPNMPSGKGSKILVDLMRRSSEILADADVNKVKVDLGENPSNMIWLWGQGKTPAIPAFQEMFGVKGGIISAVALLKGIASAAKMDIISVPGATGYYDTNYKGKAEHCIKSLEQGCDLVLVHVEAPDEAGHNGDRAQKLLAIERFDEYVVGHIYDEIKRRGDYRLMVLPDHYTPISLKTHVGDPVPFVISGAGIKADDMGRLTEAEALKGYYKTVDGHELMRILTAR
ncbi:MAG TPA: phosphoglycerate mutase, partial [bacterium]|nr:phosphoglycerate mutase [bacterium]